jgi:polyadenylate-binding protein
VYCTLALQDGAGKTKCFGFVNYMEPEAASRAVEELTGREVNGKSMYAGR